MRQIMIGDSSYTPKHRKDHCKYVLRNGPFDSQVVTLSKACHETTIFSINGERGRYVGNTKPIYKDGVKMSLREIEESISYDDCQKCFPALFWKSLPLK